MNKQYSKRLIYIELAAVIIIAVLSLAAWQFNIYIIKHPVNEIVAMNPLSAIAFILFALSFVLFLHSGRHPNFLIIARVIACAIIIIGLIKFLSIVTGISSGIDTFLYTQELKEDIVNGFQNTMSPITALSFILTALSFFFITFNNKKCINISHGLSLISLFILLLAIIRYIHKTDVFYGLAVFIPMPLYVIISFFLITFSILCIGNSKSFIRHITGKYAGSKMAKILLPMAIIIPVVLDVLQIWGSSKGLYTATYGSALFTLVNVVIFIIIIWISAAKINNVNLLELKEVERRKISEEILKSNNLFLDTILENIPNMVFVKDANNLRFLRINKEAEKFLQITSQNLIEKNDYDFFPKAQADSIIQNDRKVLASGKLMEIPEQKVTTVSGDSWLRTRKIPVFDKKNMPLYLIGISEDITEKKENESKIKAFYQELETEVKKRTEELSKSEMRYRTLFEQNLAGIYQSTPGGVILNCNEAFAKMLKYNSCQELLQANAVEVYFSLSERNDFINIVIDKKKLYNYENVLKCKDGSPLYVIENISLRKDAITGEEFFDGVIIDITRRKLAEIRLEESNERFINVSKATFDAVWDWDIKTRKLFLGDGFKELFGYECNNNIGDFYDWSAHIYPEDKERVIKKRLNKIIHHDQQTWKDEYRYIRSNGSIAYVSDRGILLRNDTGTYRMIGAMQDITRQKEEELEVAKILEERNTILESIGDGFFAVDKNWVVTYWNYHAEKMLGKYKKEMIGHPLWKIFSDSIDSISYKKYHEAVATNTVINFEDYYPALNKWYEISAYPSDSGLSVYFKDITERKISETRLNELNERLQKQAKKLATSNEELERYAYVTSHDLQEPLRMVTNFLQLLQKKYDNQLDETAQKYINFAVDGASRMKTLILDLLEFSRISSFVEDHSIINLNDVLTKTRQALRAATDESQAFINVPFLPQVCGNESQLIQLFQNLISNAIKYKNNANPVIDIGFTETEDAWQFYVQDNGIGIDPKFFEKIFIIFQRLHNRKEYEGTGIGLAICKKIVELHGGKIWIESSKEGGSKFYFTILKLQTSNSNEANVLCNDITNNHPEIIT